MVSPQLVVGTVGFSMSMPVFMAMVLAVTVALLTLLQRSTVSIDLFTAKEKRYWHLARRVRFVVGIVMLLTMLGLISLFDVRGSLIGVLSLVSVVVSVRVADWSAQWLQRQSHWPFVPVKKR
jgi:uncharacterized RDD family membrane protein YckC